MRLLLLYNVVVMIRKDEQVHFFQMPIENNALGTAGRRRRREEGGGRRRRRRRRRRRSKRRSRR